MDILNDYYPLFPENPDKEGLSDSELSDREQYIQTLTSINGNKQLTFDDWSMKYSDDTWYMWCMLKDYTAPAGLRLLNVMDYSSFCSMVYEGSTKN